MDKRPLRFDWRLIAGLLAIPVVVIVATGVRGLMSLSPTATPSPTAQTTPTQQSIVHTPLPVTVVPTPGVTVAPPIPSPREMTAMAYDGVHDDIVMFGGTGFSADTAPPPKNDTWTFDATGWRQQHPRTSPPPLEDLLMTEDPNTHDLLLVGLSSPDLPNAAVETWLWNGQTWTRATDLPANEPPISMATLIAARQVVLITYAESPGRTTPPMETHTWTWDGSKWSLRSPPTGLPLGGASPTLIGNPASRRVIALTSTTPDTGPQTWSWDGRTWSLVAASNQPPYDPITASGAEDPRSGDVVVYMGGGDSRTGGVTWILDSDGWHLADATSPALDTDYHGAQLLADTNLRAVIVVAGAGRPNPLNSLWTFTGAHWIAESPTALGPPRT